MLTSGTYCIKLIFTIIFFLQSLIHPKTKKTIFHETKMQITLFPLALEEGTDKKGGL